jgi:hypothetical protein
MKRSVVAGLVLALCSQPALAALDCSFDHAIYGQPDSSAELWFEPVDGAAEDSQSNAFTLRLGDFKRPLVGEVVWANENDERPVASLRLDCPAGSDTATPAVTDCPIWQGNGYAIDPDGRVWLLPDEGEPAPQTLLLADLGPAIRRGNGQFGYDTAETVWDVFSLRSCGK